VANAKVKLVTVCEDEHVLSSGDEFEDLVDINHCHHCGSPVYRVCPNCESAPIYAWVRSYEDGSKEWTVAEYCFVCSEPYPWGPGRVGRAIRKIDKKLADLQSPRPTPKRTILTHSRQEALQDTKYGDEVISHIQEGDRCYENRLWQPALGSYIHALEWAAIAYLEAEADVDVIEREREGIYYNLAGGKHNLLDELTNEVELDQKTISQIRGINQGERRWMAHHKTGETLQDEVDVIRARLGTFLGTLFDNEMVIG